jgi:hypothetical protein
MPSTKGKNTAAENIATSAGPAVQQPITQQAPDFKFIYTNHIQTTFSPLDVALILAEVVASEKGTWLIETKARVLMAPAEAKILKALLTNLIKAYEEKFGEIVLPPDMQVPML